MDWLEEFDSFLNHPAPAFLCRTPADYHKLKNNQPAEQLPYVARLLHIARPPAGPAALDVVRSLDVPGADEAVRFYALHDGVHLFAPAHTRYEPDEFRG